MKNRTNMLAGLLVSLVIHGSVLAYFLIGGQSAAVVVTDKVVPVKLSMFKQQPAPVSVIKSAPEPVPKPVVKKPRPKPKPKKVHKPEPSKQQLVVEPIAVEPTPDPPPEDILVEEEMPPAEIAVATMPVEMAAVAPGLIASLEEEYRSRVRQMIIERKYYPMRARRQRGEGDVVVAFTINKDGSVTNLEVLQATSSSALNRAALDAVRKVGKFPAIPEEITRSQWFFEIPLTYRLN